MQGRSKFFEQDGVLSFRCPGLVPDTIRRCKDIPLFRKPLRKDICLGFPGEVFGIFIPHVKPGLIANIRIIRDGFILREFMHRHISPVNLTPIIANVSNPSGDLRGHIVFSQYPEDRLRDS